MSRTAAPPPGSAVVADDESWASETASRLLESSSTRHAHTVGVVRQAASVCHLLAEPWQSALGEAAWLHDIG